MAGKSVKEPTVKCPSCGIPVVWTSGQPWRPFCSERCRLIDLGEWFGERHRIEGEPDGSTTNFAAADDYPDD